MQELVLCKIKNYLEQNGLTFTCMKSLITRKMHHLKVLFLGKKQKYSGYNKLGHMGIQFLVKADLPQL